MWSVYSSQTLSAAMLTKEGLLCETSEATLAMLHKMFVSEKRWKMNMALQQWREALCCKLESKGD